jgi:hypothetical protein
MKIASKQPPTKSEVDFVKLVHSLVFPTIRSCT